MLDALFFPRSVAVIGASNRPLTIGHRIVENLLDAGFTGAIYPVNPKASCVRSIPAYPSILDVPAEVDLAHVIVKNTLVPQVIADCGTRGVKVAIVNTSGFEEVGEEGADLQQELVRVARAAGVRVFGPNCQGIMNSDPEVRAYCNFTFTRLIPGHISLVAQSGGVAEVVHNRLYELAAGIRMYASNGNACDVSIPEIIEYWGDDPGTRVIVCHVESLKDPRAFLDAAQAVARRKPILALKTGRTLAGARAVSSHTGGMVREDTTTELVFDEAGVLSFGDQMSLCDAAYALSRQPLPRGNRVGIVTNAGGPGIVATDEIVEAGGEIPELAPATQEALRASLFDEAIVTNPVDTLATGLPEHYRTTLEALLRDEVVDSILLNFITPFFVDCEAVAREVAAVVPDADKPIVGVVMTRKEGWSRTLATFREAGLPVFDLPEKGARALAAMARLAALRARPEEAPLPLPGIDRERATTIVAEAVAAERSFVPQASAFELLAAYGIETPPLVEVRGLEEALEAAAAIGYPVVLKVDREDLVHKSDAGGVVLDLADEPSLAAAFDEASRRFGDPATRFVVARFVSGTGVELILGSTREPGLGPVVMFGLGGVLVEALGDVAFGLAPLSRARARELVASIRGRSVLDGARGRPPIDVAAVADALCRLSRLVADHPEIAELDLNPVLARGEGEAPVALDVRIKVDLNPPRAR